MSTSCFTTCHVNQQGKPEEEFKETVFKRERKESPTDGAGNLCRGNEINLCNYRFSRLRALGLGKIHQVISLEKPRQ